MSFSKKNLGFTFIEILIVMGIVAIFATLSVSRLANVQEKSRDTKRKTDLSQIQVAIEAYRDSSTALTYPVNIAEECAGTGGITDGANTYLSTIPHDPRCTQYSYYYNPISNNNSLCQTYMGGPAPCTCNGTTVPCDDYTLGTYLEKTSGASCAGTAGTNLCASADCNYCVGPFGKK